ncbi:hypothetical protein CR194_06095 [Salipaludibacillus keqinensis]|uniref:Glycosyltransferase 2-like domain-containing protein n=1 Tax=Salipaludibacillus keqinensis TaxID=2045207 RepID=A0A323TJQ8_9BACI|nr:hypothetical protein CR194_06095 [Salipaludibacillus keqinensis]
MQKCFNSIINQWFKGIEIIVVDNGSRDHTLKEIKKID